jgi:hypothetical protein
MAGTLCGAHACGLRPPVGTELDRRAHQPVLRIPAAMPVIVSRERYRRAATTRP